MFAASVAETAILILDPMPPVPVAALRVTVPVGRTLSVNAEFVEVPLAVPKVFGESSSVFPQVAVTVTRRAIGEPVVDFPVVPSRTLNGVVGIDQV
jgi:hypothetical protein